MQTGVCYFPEHWPRDRWEDDVERMAEAGIQYVRMAEFAWNRLEPEPGSYDFSWLHDVIGLLAAHDMQAVLCTPTATPPKWLVDRHPNIRQERPDGTPLEFGSRRHYCYNSPTYRDETRRIVSRMAEEFGGVDTVVGWQTDNEYGCHETIRCYCDDCTAAFREWLQERYGSIEALNKAWGTAFWSQAHRSFDEIDVPGPTPADHHPSRILDFHRFASASATAYNRFQTEILRAADDSWFVTHNFMGDFEPLDPGPVSDDLDFASWDSYPTLHAQRAVDTPAPDSPASAAGQVRGDPDVTAMNHDLYRSVSTDPFWVMEHQAGDVRGLPYAAEPAEGMIRLWSHQAVAHGAGVVSYFRWRRCRFGQEQYWGALCNYDGSADRGLPEASTAAAEFEELPDLEEPTAPVAIVLDYDSMWAIHADRQTPDFEYLAHLRRYYRALRERGITVDLVPPNATLKTYAAVIAPSLHLVTPELATRLEQYVREGGVLLGTVRTGVKDRSHKLRKELAPGPLADVFGLRVPQHESLAPGVDVRVELDDAEHAGSIWREWLEPEEAVPIARHASGVAAGEVAIAANELGAGWAGYVGVWPDAALAEQLVTDLLDRAGVPATDPLPETVRIATRDDHTWVFNFGTEPIEVELPVPPILGSRRIPGRDLAVVESPDDAISISSEKSR